MKVNLLSKCLSLLIAVIIIFSTVPLTNGATKYEVNVKKTDIQADIVFNTEGYASLTKKYRLSEEEKADAYRSLTEYELEEGETVEDYLEKNGFENIEEYYLDGDYTTEHFADYSALMDKNGKIIMPYTYALNSYYVSDEIISKGNWYNIYSYNDKETNGYFDLSGKKINKNDYPYSRNFSNGIAFVRNKASNFEEEGFTSGLDAYLIDKNDNIVLSLPKDFAYSYGIGDGPLGFTGNYNFCGVYSEGLIDFSSMFRYTVSIFEKKDQYPQSDVRLTGYMDIEGNIVIPQKYYSGGPFHNGMAWVQEPVTADHEYIYNATYVTGGKFGYINNSGELVVPFIYDDVTNFDGKYAAVSKDGKWGLINTKGETVIPFEYEYMAINDGIITCSTDIETSPVTLMTVDKEIIWQTAAKNVDASSVYDEGVLYYTKDGYVYIVSVTSENVPDNIKGDIDGDGAITSSDARLTLRAAVGLENLTEETRKLIDVDKNGTVTASDARLILRAAVGLEDPAKW